MYFFNQSRLFHGVKVMFDVKVIKYILFLYHYLVYVIFVRYIPCLSVHCNCHHFIQFFLRKWFSLHNRINCLLFYCIFSIVKILYLITSSTISLDKYSRFINPFFSGSNVRNASNNSSGGAG